MIIRVLIFKLQTKVEYRKKLYFVIKLGICRTIVLNEINEIFICKLDGYRSNLINQKYHYIFFDNPSLFAVYRYRGKKISHTSDSSVMGVMELWNHSVKFTKMIIAKGKHLTAFR